MTMNVPFQTSRFFFRPLLGALSLALLFCCSSALAEGKVTKQGGCKLQVDGLPNVAVGMSVSIKDGAKNYTAKVLVAKPPRALVAIEGQAKCPQLVGKMVVAESTAQASPAAATATGSPSKPKFGLSVSPGVSYITWQKPVMNQTALTYQGLDMNGTAMFLLNVSKAVSIPIKVGVSRFSNVVNLQGSGTDAWTYTMTALLVRGGTGVHFAFVPSVVGLVDLFFDYGVSKSLTVTGTTSDAAPKPGTYPLAGVMRYGGTAGLEYLFSPHFGVGLEGSFFLGSARVNSNDLEDTPDIASHALMGFGGLGRISAYF